MPFTKAIDIFGNFGKLWKINNLFAVKMFNVKRITFIENTLFKLFEIFRNELNGERDNFGATF